MKYSRILRNIHTQLGSKFQDLVLACKMRIKNTYCGLQVHLVRSRKVAKALSFFPKPILETWRLSEPYYFFINANMGFQNQSSMAKRKKCARS